MSFTKNNKRLTYDYMFSGQSVSNAAAIKDLTEILSDGLTFKHHINRIGFNDIPF